MIKTVKENPTNEIIQKRTKQEKEAIYVGIDSFLKVAAMKDFNNLFPPALKSFLTDVLQELDETLNKENA